MGWRGALVGEREREREREREHRALLPCLGRLSRPATTGVSWPCSLGSFALFSHFPSSSLVALWMLFWPALPSVRFSSASLSGLEVFENTVPAAGPPSCVVRLRLFRNQSWQTRPRRLPSVRRGAPPSRPHPLSLQPLASDGEAVERAST